MALVNLPGRPGRREHRPHARTVGTPRPAHPPGPVHAGPM